MKVAILINFVPPYHIPLLSLLKESVGELKVFVSTKMERNRSWEAEWGGLTVVQQKTITVSRKWVHPAGFSDTRYVHFPLDTIPLLLSCSPDVVITTEMGARTIGAVLYKMLRRKTRLLLWLNLSERTESGRGWAAGAMRRLILRLADGVFVNGASGARYLKSLGVRPGTIHRLPYPTDAAMFAHIPLARSGPTASRLLYVGQLVPRKGVLPFIATLVKWAVDHQATTVELSIVGEGDLRRSIELLKVPPNLHLTLEGTAAYKELPRYYASSGILVFPTLADEWGIVVNEALASGLPVLGSIYSQAAEEMILDGVTGWLLDPEVPAQVYAAVDRALSTPIAALHEMRKACRARALQYAPDQLVHDVLRALRGNGGDQGSAHGLPGP
jgi:glycosyltransferase involved in cell wall biosynthesis